MKKILSVIISLFILSQAGICVFAESNMLNNGSFEKLTGENKPENWISKGADYGKSFTVTNDSADGSNALRLQGGTAAYSGLVPVTSRADYTIALKHKGGLSLIIGYYNSEGKKIGEDEAFSITESVDGWTDGSITFTARLAASAVSIMLESRDAYIDDIFLGRAGAKAGVEEDGENLISNGGFEDVQDGKAKGWQYSNAGWNQNTTIDTSNVYKGKYSLRMSKADGEKNGFACFTIPVTARDVYKLSAMYSCISEGTHLKVEYYSDNYISSETYIIAPDTELLKKFENTNRVWTKAEHFFTPPDGCVMAAVYVALRDVGEVWFDEVTCNKTGGREKGPMLELDAEYFYYTDWLKGEAFAELNTVDYEFSSGDKAVFEIYDGEKLITSGEGFKTGEDRIKYEFDINKLSVIGRDYTIKVRYKNQAGETLFEASQPVSRYDRPEMMNEKGQIIINGSPFFLVEGMTTNSDEIYDHIADIGINAGVTAKIGGTIAYNNIDEIRAKVDAHWANGMYSRLLLYISRNGGNKAVYEQIKGTVNALKNHPGVLLYCFMDEPGDGPVMVESLRQCFKYVREVDTKHPIAVVECTPSAYRVSGKNVDIMIIDPYQGSDQATWTLFTDRLADAREAVKYRKPIYGCMRAFHGTGYTLSANVMRYMPYTYMMSGIDGLSWWPIGDTRASATDTKTMGPVWERGEMWEGMKGWTHDDMKDAIDSFFYSRYPVFNWGREENVWWNSYVNDGSIYLVVLNKKNESVKVDIPLVSYDGAITIGNFTAEAVDISNMPPVSGNGNFEVELPALQVAKYRISYTGSYDFGKLTKSDLYDIYDYPWAKTAIDTLYDKGIVNTKGVRMYSPGENITRGEFAYALIRTLGFSENTDKKFLDVGKSDYFAKEIGTGLALGIFEGDEKGCFRPEDEISRQDMMTLVARALKLPEGADIQGFSDRDKIAAYAVGSVSAVHKAGLIKGNPDGSINPLGNATRAEAAVMLYRVYTSEQEFSY